MQFKKLNITLFMLDLNIVLIDDRISSRVYQWLFIVVKRISNQSNIPYQTEVFDGSIKQPGYKTYKGVLRFQREVAIQREGKYRGKERFANDSLKV